MQPRVVLAPLAGGPSTPELAAAVSNAGGLGFVAAGYLTPEALGGQLQRARSLTDGPLAVNLFLLREQPVDAAALATYAAELEPEAQRLGVQLGEPRFDDDWLDAKLALLAEQPVEVVSFTFGCPAQKQVDAVRATGAEAWVTVTSLAEAQEAERCGADALVVQGCEAGGHRGGWGDEDGVPLLELLAALAATTALPLVATGGITRRSDVRAALDAGAQSVQAGTSFLLAPEAGTNDALRRALGAPGETAVTRAFTGKRARGIVNRFMREHRDAPLAYPHVHHLTAPLRAAARAAGDADVINLWAGTNYAHAQALPAAEIVAQLRA